MESSLSTRRGHALRLGRFSEPGRCYLPTTVTQDRIPLFNDCRLARLVITEMRRLHEAKDVESLAWVVMPDHLHWLVTLTKLPLHQLMQQLKSRSAVSINQMHRRRGRIWQKGFHDRALRQEDDLIAAARYVVANPLRAGLTQHLALYPHWDAVWL